MEVFEAICTRRSIRKFTWQLVPDEIIHELLVAAMYAPSAGNEQPWHFVIIRDRQTLDAIADFHPYAKMARQVPVAVLVCGDPSVQKYEGRWILDCAAATQNILLAAHGKELGAVWVGIYPETGRMSEMRKLLALPEGIMPVSLIPVGYPAEHPPRPERFDDLRIHYEQW
jgi:nitroreductase